VRVVHAITKYPPAIGGLERHVQGLAVGLRVRGIDARVVASDLRRHRPPVLRIASGEDAGDGVPVVRLPTVDAGTRHLAIPGMTERLVAERPDVLVTWDVWSPAWASACEAARRLAVPLVASPIFHERDARWTPRLREACAALPGRALVLFHTPWEERRLAELGCRFARTALHTPSVDLRELDGEPAPLPPGVPEGCRLVTLVGRVTHSKGVDVLLHAFADARRRLAAEDAGEAERLHLVIAGFVDSDERFEPEAERLGLGRHATFVYDRPRGEILALLRDTEIFALPSRAEAFGIVVLEAWAQGALVLASDRTALPFVVTHDVDGLVSPLETFGDALLDALRLHGTPERERLVAAGRRAARERHERERSVDDFVALLERAGRTSEPERLAAGRTSEP
jgi:glycosyltransferase involved in cell wall biosynthesis